MTIKETVRVQPGGRVELVSSALPEGAEAEVTVVVRQAAPKRSLQSFIGSAKGVYASPAEADEFIRKLRDEWES
jgi:hypothetical protein